MSDKKRPEYHDEEREEKIWEQDTRRPSDAYGKDMDYKRTEIDPQKNFDPDSLKEST